MGVSGDDAYDADLQISNPRNSAFTTVGDPRTVDRVRKQQQLMSTND